jgi:nucleoside-diphosphate-sugar epimerase
MANEEMLTAAVTGPTGTFGFALIPQLQEEERVKRIVGIARRPFDPVEHGWTKMSYLRGDVREPATLRRAFDGADVAVHLAFMITGTASRETIREINVEGTLNTFRAAAEAGVKRFVYASSVAAYGFHRDNPVPMDERWPARPASHLFYAQEKAEIERLLREEVDQLPELELYLLRPPIVLGPHAVGAKNVLPGPLEPAGRRLAGLIRRAPLPIPVPVPRLPLQLIHEEDVARAFLLCTLGAGPPGVYNIAADGVVTADQVARELGFTPVPVPGRPVRRASRLIASLPLAPPLLEWAESASHPAIMETSRAKSELGWQPHYSGLEALRETLTTRG